MVKIEDIAKAVGVSPATVSRVLNNSGKVASATREAVLSASQRLGRSLDPELTRKKVLAACMPSGRDLMDPLITAAEHYNMSVLFKLIDRFPLTAEDVAFDGDFDGAILIDSVVTQEEMNRLQAHMAVVECRDYSGLQNEICALVDDIAVGYVTARHLLETGKSRIAFAQVDSFLAELPYGRERRQGYLAALAEEGLMPAAMYWLDREDTLERMFDDAGTVWDALIYPSPVEELSALKHGLIQKGLKLPEDVALAVLEDGPVARRCEITAIAQPLDAIAQGALFLLDAQMADRLSIQEPMRLRFQPELILRGSTTS